MVKNTIYSTPEAELLVIRMERNLLGGPSNLDETLVNDGEEPLDEEDLIDR